MPHPSTSRIIVFSRLPQAGKTKTRLIPALGVEGAAAFHDRLARQMIGRASGYAMGDPVTALEIRIAGGNPAEARGWLGKGDWREQGGGDLGQRMARASSEAFDAACSKVVIVGTDCPRLGDDTFTAAFDALDRSDVVFGPAVDGGYYLLGLSAPCPEIFEGISWGEGEVLADSLKRAHALGLGVTMLDELPDVDVPGDLPDGEVALDAGSTISVIIPTLNEEAHLGETLRHVLADHPHEVIVADGGSADATVSIARDHGAKVVSGVSGRALQMNHGAAAARGEFLLFLHADTRPPPNYSALVWNSLNRPSVAAGAFRLELDGEFVGGFLVEKLTEIRCRFCHLPYGDQGLFLRRSLFAELGGFPDWPVMEDLDLVRNLRRLGEVIVTREPARSSARRWEKQGLVRTFLRHQIMLGAYYLGIPPQHIARMRK